MSFGRGWLNRDLPEEVYVVRKEGYGIYGSVETKLFTSLSAAKSVVTRERNYGSKNVTLHKGKIVDWTEEQYGNVT